jgi:uncharacterized protein (DUF305 family)
MSIRNFILAAAATITLTCGALAQENHSQHATGGAMPMTADSLPEECRTAAQTEDDGGSMLRMDKQSASQDRQGMMARMSEAQKGYLQSMAKMRGPMQTGIMAKDPDVGFICGMIPHHQGAVDMAEVVLKTGRNAEAKAFAEQVIREQGREITWMKNWLKQHAGRNPAEVAGGVATGNESKEAGVVSSRSRV